LSNQNNCHQWTQSPAFVPSWAEPTSTPVCPLESTPVVEPNPVFPATASLQMCTPIQLVQTSPTKVLVTVSIPAETIFTLPTRALEIKNIRKNLKITQSRFFNFSPRVCGKPQDTPKLFLGGFVRKDIQFSEAIRQTAHTVEGVIRDFVVDVPFTCVVDLGRHLAVQPTNFNQQHEYEFLRTQSLPSGFSPKDQLMSGDISEFNMVSNEFFNSLPTVRLVFSQINEMDDAIDRVALVGGPFEEGTFRTVQEKMIILIQLQLTFPDPIDPSFLFSIKELVEEQIIEALTIVVGLFLISKDLY